MHYSQVLHKNLEALKKKDIEHFDTRNDYKQVVVLRDYDKHELMKIFQQEYPSEQIQNMDMIKHTDTCCKSDELIELQENNTDLKTFKKKFKREGIEHFSLLERFGEEYDTSTTLNQMIDEENRDVRK